MNIDIVNQELSKYEPERLIIQSFNIRDGELVLAFSCDGGPKESEALVVCFKSAWMFHLKSVIDGYVRLSKTKESEREKLIPAFGYDPLELTGDDNAYTVIKLTDEKGMDYGYYIIAEEITKSEWVPSEKCLWVW